MEQIFNINEVISSLQNLKERGFDTCSMVILKNVPFYDADRYTGWTQSELLIHGVDGRDSAYNETKCVHSLDKKLV